MNIRLLDGIYLFYFIFVYKYLFSEFGSVDDSFELKDCLLAEKIVIEIFFSSFGLLLFS